MSCSINRYKFVGNVGNAGKSDTLNTASAKAMETRMQEMLAVRAAQDGGNFKTRPSWDPLPGTDFTKPN